MAKSGTKVLSLGFEGRRMHLMPWHSDHESERMEIDINIHGPKATDETASLLRWLQSERLREVNSLQRKEQPPKPGEQGATLLAILTVVLASPAVVKLVESIHRWIDATRPSIRISIKTKDGREVIIDAKNPKSLQELILAAKSLEEK